MVKVRLPTCKRLISLEVAMRHIHKIPRVNKPKLTAWELRHIKSLSRERQQLHRQWWLSHWAREVKRLAVQVQREPTLKSIKKDILAENVRIYTLETKDHHIVLDCRYSIRECPDRFVFIREKNVQIKGDTWLSFQGELHVPTALYWHFILSEQYQQFLKQDRV